jgi:hypothetical protein
MPARRPVENSAAQAAWMHDPDATTRSFARRADRLLPFDPAKMPPDVPVMLDTNVYIARAQNRLPTYVAAFIEARAVLHSAVALAELTITAGILEPRNPRTKLHRDPLRRLLESIDLSDCRSPSAAGWAEAGMLAGILARTQLGLAKPKNDLSPAETCCQQGRRRELLNDALIFLSAREQNAILISSNVTDMDFLSRFRMDVYVLLYRQSLPAAIRRAPFDSARPKI